MTGAGPSTSGIWSANGRSGPGAASPGLATLLTLSTSTVLSGFVGDWNAYRSVMSVWTLPPGGVRPGASRWSAARADDGAALCVNSTARAIAPATANSNATPTVRLLASVAAFMNCSLLSFSHDLVRSACGSPARPSWFDGRPDRTGGSPLAKES